MIEKCDEFLKGALEVDVVFPKGVVGVDDEVLADHCFKSGRRPLVCRAGREMEGNFEHGIYLDGSAVAQGRLEFPLGEGFGGASVETAIEAVQHLYRIHAPILADDRGEADGAFDALLASRG